MSLDICLISAMVNFPSKSQQVLSRSTSAQISVMIFDHMMIPKCRIFHCKIWVTVQSGHSQIEHLFSFLHSDDSSKIPSHPKMSTFPWSDPTINPPYFSQQPILKEWNNFFRILVIIQITWLTQFLLTIY